MLTATVLSLLLAAGTALSQSGCPATPDTSVPCTGNVTNCRFGTDTTCCNGDVQFVGKILSCQDGKWLAAIADGCLFGCSPVCPDAEPKNGEHCTVDTHLTCNYENSQAKCVGGKWSATSCKADADCGKGTFCWNNMCIFYQQDQEPCGGFTFRPLNCEPSLPCIPPPPSNPPIADRPGRCGCRLDSECGAKAFCWESQCIPYKQAGEKCGGFTRIPSRCDPSLTCIPDPRPIADIPGTCAVNSTVPTTCPKSPPTSGCSGKLSCPYGKNTTCCNGDVQFVGKIYECHSGGWQVAVADGCMFGCTDQCPAETPRAGDRCVLVTTKTCKYPGKNARCVRGKWQLQTRPSYFGLGEAVKQQLKP